MSVKNLVIVESPAKAKTIEKFLGKDFSVKSSFGHIRDLPKKDMGVDIEHNFEPKYVISDDKKKVISELKKAAKDATVWLASDEDREGEAIAWHLSEALGLDSKKTKRIVFHEITKGAITKAVENPRTIDQHLVDAQQARRVLDRLVGYELSPVLWQKIKGGLSAGRVQSVAVRLIVEREREITAFEGDSVFKVVAIFEADKTAFKAELPKKFETEDAARTWMEKLIGANFTVSDLQQKPGKKSPSAPFTTSTLQQEASRKLGFSVKQTMSVAQKLYESGKITYMRTDSVNLSDVALAQAASEIEKNYGKEYVEVRKYKTKSSGAQEAHEAIRPTDLSVPSISGENQQQKLYDLIWKRTVASQMAEAKLEKTVATIDIQPGKFAKNEGHFIAEGEIITFEGFLKVYLEGTDDEDEKKEAKRLPHLEVGQSLVASEITAKETYPRPPARYTEASLVKQLEQMGIGRPSTYAPTISTVQDRGYIEKRGKEAAQRSVKIFKLLSEQLSASSDQSSGVILEETIQENYGAEKNKLFPTDIGGVVTDFLVKHFGEVVDYGFTAKVEEEFDQVAEGKHKWNQMISQFYGPFHKLIEKSSDLTREESSSSRELGTDPKSGKPVIARIGRFGPMIQIGTKDDEEKPRFASIPDGESMETITLEVALKQFEFPRVLGKSKDGEEISVGLGKYGPYVKEGKTYASLKKRTTDEEGNEIPGDDPASVTLERALELLKEKKEQQKNKYVAQWPEKDMELLRGPYGIYIKCKKKNYRIPKSVKDPEKLTLEECEKIVKGELK